MSDVRKRLIEGVRRFERGFDRVFLPNNPPWWYWPAALAGFGTFVFAISLVFGPGEGEDVLLAGHPFGAPCAFYLKTGHPCPQCGMTRSWIWAARGHVIRSFWYNPAGATLFWWLVIGGLIGWVRLLTRDRNALRPHPNVLLAWLVFWLVGLYLGPWIGRVMWDLNPLPTPSWLHPT